MRNLLRTIFLGILGFLGYRAIRSLLEVEREFRRKINTDYALTGYVDEELLERLKENLDILLEKENPRLIYVGEIDNPELKAHRFRRFDSAYILYKTTSLDFAKQVMDVVIDFLRSRNMDVFSAGMSHRKDARQHHVYVGFVRGEQ